MDMIETDAKDIINEKKDSDLNHQNQYRNVVRSKILRRIHEKSELFDDSTGDDDVGHQQEPSIGIDSAGRSNNNDPSNIDDNLVVDDSKINEKVRRQLSNEWRKTLERVLNYRQDYLDDKLVVKRKDSIRFFIQADWPNETEDANDDDDEEEEEDEDDADDPNSNSRRRRRRRRKRKSKKKKIKKNPNQAINPPPEFDPEKLLVVRMKPSRSEPEPGIERILTESFEFEPEWEYDDDDEQLVEKLQQFVRHRCLIRLLRERIDLHGIPVERFVRNFQERYLVQQDPGAMVPWNQDLLLLNHLDLVNKSKFYKIFMKTLQTIMAPTKRMANDEDHILLNNRGWMLSIGMIRMDFQRHPRMEREDKMIKKLCIAYRKYRESISVRSESKLQKLQQQIDLLVAKIDQFQNDDQSKNHHHQEEQRKDEREMDLKLLQRLTTQFDQMILTRRKSLIKLIEQWSRFQNDLDKYPRNSELNQIDLRLDETANGDDDEEQERVQWEQLFEWRLKIETIILLLNDPHHRAGDTDTDPEPPDRSNQIKAQVKQNVFLLDGRLPGEPKFKDIELVIPRNVSSNHQDHLLNVQYYIEVLIGQRIVATFDPRPLLRRSFEIGWDLYRSFPMPIILSGNDVYRFATTTTNNDADVDDNEEEKDKEEEEEEDYHRRLPRIRIKERTNCTTMKLVKTIAEIRMQGLPLPVMDSKERSMRISDRIHYIDDDGDDNDDDDDESSVKKAKAKKSILEANVEFRAFWQSLPSSSSLSSSSSANEQRTLSERFWLYDETKRKIMRTKDLDRIDQWLHDLRYQILDDLDPVGANFIEDSTGDYPLVVAVVHHHWYQRRIMELMQLLLKQKYQLELMRIFQAKKQQLAVDRTAMANSSNNRERESPAAGIREEDDGTFCTDEEIETNKRFQMMLQRSQGLPGYRDYRFMPLTTMDLFLMPDSLTTGRHTAGNLDLGRRSTMIQVVWQFLRRTCQLHQERLNDHDQTGGGGSLYDDPASTAVISHDWCDDDNQWFQCVQQVLHQIWTTKSITTRDDQQPPLTMVDHDDPGIVHYHEIVRESSPLDALAGFSWLNSLLMSAFNPTAPSALVQLANQRHRLNPTRKNRHTDAIQIQDALQRDCQVHLLVQQASNVPLKVKMMSKKKKDTGRSGSGRTGLAAPCSSYVEIQIDGPNETAAIRNQLLQTMSTSMSTGDQPSWNESFKFKTKIDLRKKILLNLFVVNKSVGNPSAIHEDDDDDDDDDGHLGNDHLGDDPLHNHDHSKLERVWLGQLRIPLKTLLFRPKIEGSFRLFTPYFLKSFRSFSNTKTDDQEDPTNRKAEEGSKFSKNVDKLLALHRAASKDPAELDSPLTDVRLSVFITTDPLIDSNKNLAPNLNPNSLEPSELIQYCDRWLQPLCKRFPQRRFVCMVDNCQHRSILATRFLAPLKPPDFDQLSPIKLEDLKKSTTMKSKKQQHDNKMTRLANQERLYVQLIIRFVSLIPSLLDQQPAVGGQQQQQQSSSRFIQEWSRKQIWLDVEQFLTIRLGGQAEHAILLSCFLQYLDKKAYLVLGTSQLDGPAVYVIVYPSGQSSADDLQPQPDRHQQLPEDTGGLEVDHHGRNASKFRLILIDPKRGQQFSVQDFHCTLSTVDTIITPDNVYANIQKSNHPSLISYNLKRANHWQPLFATYRARMPDFSTTLDFHVQPSSIDYGGLRADRAKNLELKLENYLREQFMLWRRRLTGNYTAFNRFCGQIIKQSILPELERHSCLFVFAGGQQQQHERYFREKRAEIEQRVRKELQQVLDLHTTMMISYPLNIRSGLAGHSAWNFEQLSRLIHSTQLHQIHFGSPQQVEYVLVCYVHPYPCDLYSIWIWLSALTTKSAA